MRLTEYSKHKIITDERFNILTQIQQEEQRQGHIPPSPRLWLRIHHKFLEATGAVMLGISLGMLTAIFNFILFVYLLHLEL